MPVLRQGVDTGSGQLQIGGTNYMVGAAAPQVNEVQPKQDTRGQAIQSFLGNFLDTFTPAIQQGQQRAAAQGQIDASADPDALKNSDSAADKQNIFMREAYQKGYLGAAIQQSVNDFQAGINTRAQQAGLNGVSDEEFMQNERQQNAQLMQSLSNYLPHAAPETVSAVASSLDNTRNSALNMLRKTRMGQAKVNNNRTVEQGGFQAIQSFSDSMSAGNNFDQSWHYLEDQAKMIGSNAIMDEKEKKEQLHNLFLTVAQGTNDPDVINQLAGKAAGIMGVTDPSLTSALHSEWNRAGTQQAGATLMDLQNRYDNIGTLPAYQQADAKGNFEHALIDAQTSGRISTGQMMEFYNKVHKEQTPKLQMQGMVSAVSGQGGGLSVEALHAAAPGVTRDQIHSAITEAFPDTIEGNTKMLAAGAQGNDPWVIKTALSRVGSQMTDQLETLSTVMKPVTDENGNTSFQIPQAVQQNVVGFMAMYQSSDDITKQTLMNTLPQDWQGVIKSAIEQDPTNVNNNVLDTIKRVSSEKASGMYKDVSATPTDKMLNTDSALRWYQRINPVTTDSEESQRAAMNQQLQAEYNRIYNTDKGLLTGKSADTINKMLVGNIQARTVPVSIGRFAANVTLPAGTTLDSYAAAAGVDANTYQKSFQTVADSVFKAQGINVDNMDSVRIEPNTGGAQSKDFTLSVVTKGQNGLYTTTRIAMPNSTIARNAQSQYAAMIDQQRADGSQKAGTQIATFMDHSRGGYQTMEVSGTNSTGLAPTVFNNILSNTMRYEGFKSTKSNGSVGYGWHEASGDNVPDRLTPQEGQQKLKELYENRYIPMTRGYMKDAGISGDTATSILADLAYQRPADSKALATAMGQFKRGEISPYELSKVLPSLPSFKDAGGTAQSTRNRERAEALLRWSNFEGNPRVNNW
ncbi:putative internal virion protein [Pantoea phage LIMElight]|uniref:Putative internal virion protein n=1 Tax=Pantoea phage LIMElight TaxID=881915 RepID=E1Y3V2_9CAUD|nr:internal virion lysozyme motif [Pantoea phage LIMElight]CBW54804.1 putative internal virion protein [Pantoea phage LIMElight]